MSRIRRPVNVLRSAKAAGKGGSVWSRCRYPYIFAKALSWRHDEGSSAPKMSSASADPAELRREASISRQVEEQLLRGAYRDALPGQFASAGVAAILVAAAGASVPRTISLGWALAMYAIIALRIRHTLVFRKLQPQSADIRLWRSRFILGAGVLGCCWGTAAWLFVNPAYPALLALMSFIMAGFVAGVARVFSPVLPAFFAFVVPYISILIASLIFNLGSAAWSIVGATLCYTAFVSWVARSFHRDCEISQRLQIENSDLVSTLRSAEGQLKDRVAALQHEIEERKRAESELAFTHGQLIEASRRAGQAEIATNVLHNVGNVLNSAVVSCSQLCRWLRESKTERVQMVSDLLQQNRSELGPFFAPTRKGEKLLEYLPQLSAALRDEQEDVRRELNSLSNNLDHIQAIVAMQQDYARVGGVTEMVGMAKIIDHAIAINEEAIEAQRVNVVRQYDAVAVFPVDRHRVLQILVNLIKNAVQAMSATNPADRTLRVRLTAGPERAAISVADTGVGIGPDDLLKIFRHGYSTRKDGHGFGLHSGALVARELGGELRVESAGAGRGATFTLELPLQPQPATTKPLL